MLAPGDHWITSQITTQFPTETERSRYNEGRFLFTPSIYPPHFLTAFFQMIGLALNHNLRRLRFRVLDGTLRCASHTNQ